VLGQAAVAVDVGEVELPPRRQRPAAGAGPPIPPVLEDERPELRVSFSVPARISPETYKFAKQVLAELHQMMMVEAGSAVGLAALRAAGVPQAERAFVVHGTMADVRWTDPTQDPSDRRPYECYLGVPKVANDGPVGLARFTTLRSWLSQWGYDTTNATGLGNAARITCPVLVINNTADLACTPSHARRLFEAIGHDRKEYRDIAGADHYYIERPDLLPEAVATCSDWLARTFG
jgi:pimeloyl-ACP methyl ester carboxylesterase